MRQAVLFPILVLGVAPVLAADLPQRKSGLWELKVQSFRNDDSRTMQMCVDQKTDNAFRQLVEMRSHESCKKVTLRREGDKQLVDADCKLGGSARTAQTHAVITGSFDSQYKIESTSTFDQPIHGKSEGTGKIEARWTGPCQPDQKPGDLILPNGSKVNINEAQDSGSKSSKGLFSPPEKKKKKSGPSKEQ